MRYNKFDTGCDDDDEDARHDSATDIFFKFLLAVEGRKANHIIKLDEGHKDTKESSPRLPVVWYTLSGVLATKAASWHRGGELGKGDIWELD